MTLNPDELRAAPIAKPQGGRVVRLMGNDDNEETSMPTGVYERKARAKKPTEDAKPGPKKRGRKRRAVAVVPEVAVPRVNGSKGRCYVMFDLGSGAATIHATSGSLKLEPDEVLALLGVVARK